MDGKVFQEEFAMDGKVFLEEFAMDGKVFLEEFAIWSQSAIRAAGLDEPGVWYPLILCAFEGDATAWR